MKAELKFDLSNEDDNRDFIRCVKSTDMALALFEISRNLKKKCEYICDSMEADSDQYDGVYTVFQQIHEVLDNYNIDIDELIN